MSDLLPCPFCGKIPTLEKFPMPLEEGLSGYLCTVFSGCGLQMPGYGDEATTIRIWNTRAPTAKQEASDAD